MSGIRPLGCPTPTRTRRVRVRSGLFENTQYLFSITALYCVPSAAANRLHQHISFFFHASLQGSQSITEMHLDSASLGNLTTAVSRHCVRSQTRYQSISISFFLSIQSRPRSDYSSILFNVKGNSLQRTSQDCTYRAKLCTTNLPTRNHTEGSRPLVHEQQKYPFVFDFAHTSAAAVSKKQKLLQR